MKFSEPVYGSPTLKERAKADLKAAKDICDRALAERKDPTAAEWAEIKARTERAEGLLAQADRQARSKGGLGADGNRDLINQLDSLQYVRSSDGYGSKGLFTPQQAEGFVNAVKTRTSYKAEVDPLHLKSTVTTGDAFPALVDTDPVVAPMPSSLVSLRDTMTVKQAAGPSQRVYRVNTVSSGDVGEVAEGGLKPEANLGYDYEDLAVQKLAAVWKFSDEIQRDAGFLITQLSQQVMRAVATKENELIVSAWAGTSGIQTATNASIVDGVAAAIGNAEALNGVTPDTVAINPTDFATLRTLKAETSGTYVSDPWSAGPPTIHGAKILSTVAVPQGTVYVLTPGYGTFYVRDAVEVSVGFVGDDWQRNLSTARIEERVLPAVTQPAFVTQVTIGA